MKEIVVNITEVRKDLSYVEDSHDLLVVQNEVDYLADEATERIHFAILEANDTLLAISALKLRPIIEKATAR